jgi:hypothetical protein
VIQLSHPSSPADGRTLSRATIAVAIAASSALALTVVLGLATLLGERVRDQALIADRAAPPVTALSYTDAPQSAAFFGERDSVHVRVTRDMTVGEFLALYHLETNQAARAALERQLGATELDDRLREGDEVTFALTARRATNE